jgi:hypothetical protein
MLVYGPFSGWKNTQQWGYSGFMPNSLSGEILLYQQTTHSRLWWAGSTQFFNLQCFQQKTGWSFNYFGSPFQVDQVFAMPAPATGEPRPPK